MKFLLAILLLSVGVFAQEIDLGISLLQPTIQRMSVSPEVRRITRQYEYYRTMRRRGTWMVAGGATAALWGLSGSMAVLVNAGSHDDHLILPLFILGCLGTIYFVVGVPTLIRGRVGEVRYRNLLPNSASLSPNGALLTWNF